MEAKGHAPRTELPPDVGALIEAARIAAPHDAWAAAHLLGRGIEMLPIDHPVRSDLVLEVLPLTTWGGRPRRAEDLARAELLGADTRRAALLRPHLAHALGAQDRWAEASSIWATVVEGAVADRSDRLTARAEHAAALAGNREIEAARRLAREVLAAGSSLDPVAAYASHQALAACHYFEGRAEEGVVAAARMVEIAEAGDALVLRWRNPHLVYGFMLSVVGRIEEGRRALERARSTAQQCGALWAAPAYQFYLGNVYFRQGTWARALTEYAEGMRVCATTEGTWERAALICHSAVIKARRGAFQRAELLILRAADLDELNHGDRTWSALATALIAEGQGRSEDAFRQLRSVWREAKGIGVVQSVMQALPDLVRLVNEGDHPELGREIVERFDELAADNPGSSPVRALAAHSRGVALRSARDLEEAIAGHASCAHLPHEALAWEELAVVLAEAGRPRKAMGALRQALDRFDSMGAVADASRLRARLRRHGVIAPAPVVDSLGNGKWATLTKTEKVVASLVAEGLKNQEIATRLFVSVHTVQTHLKRVFKKLDASSRSQVVRHILRLEDEEAWVGSERP